MMLRSALNIAVLTIASDLIRVQSLLSQRQYSQSLQLAKKDIALYPTMTQDNKQTFEADEAIAEAYLGQRSAALAHMYDVLGATTPDTDPGDRAALQLIEAEVELALGNAQDGRRAASDAAVYFESHERLDSALRSDYLSAAASKRLDDNAGETAYLTKIIDIQRQLQHTWTASTLELYLSRPDLKELRRDLPQATLPARSDL